MNEKSNPMPMMYKTIPAVLRCRMPASVCSLPMLLLTVRARCLEAVFRFPGRLLSGNQCQMRRRGP